MAEGNGRPTGHRLIDILASGPEMERTVVRWCADCGAVVVDIDSDGRTQPGAQMSMRFPLMTINASLRRHKESTDA